MGKDLSLDAYLRNLGAGVGCGAFVVCLFNPLDVLRVR